ncbi:MAG TPA: hypothetical protein P5555_12040 [Candidatus Paceibacterota bacterium]|nr:hypothetical protein [Verrucomicrobiota bacterium]HRZ45911.1 hypothetical protein [Candidatus Paceibacterota bacterium]HRZ91476.1 hypothetical protein [Candidatus Paceibacterota bacterium]
MNVYRLNPSCPGRRRQGWRAGLVELCLAAALMAAFGASARAQWLTQSFSLKAGWNAVYLHVDASHADLQELVGADAANPIEEIWMWKPEPGTQQFVESPLLPTGTGSPWVSWLRALGPSSSLQRLEGNAAYLVRVRAAAADYVWNLVGKPVAPQYSWTITGLNFIGFPTPAENPPSYETFLSGSPDLLLNAEIYRYVGGDLGPSNPLRLFALRTTPLRRGEAFWIRAGTSFNRYYGPFEIDLQSGSGVHFHDSIGQYRIRLRNLVAAELIVTVARLDSAPPPAGQTAIAGPPPLLLRGALDAVTLTYGHADFDDGPQTRTLAPSGQVGSETDLVIGLNRSRMTGQPGGLYAGILRFTDSMSLSRVDVPVTALVASQAGLWVGEASVSQVRHYLKNYERDESGQPVQSATGAYQVLSTNTTLGSVPRSFPLRLILHSDAAGAAVLLQRVHYGKGFEGGMILAAREQSLSPEGLGDARRISAAHLPWSAANLPWAMTGELKEGATAAATVSLNYDDQAANPFLHTYHPDHDSRNAAFDQILPQGGESYGVRREIALRFAPPPGDFDGLTTSGGALQGVYEESVTLLGKGSESRQFDVRGAFQLNCISDIPTLTTE